jgi:hypothetical protein
MYPARNAATAIRSVRTDGSSTTTTTVESDTTLLLGDQPSRDWDPRIGSDATRVPAADITHSRLAGRMRRDQLDTRGRRECYRVTATAAQGDRSPGLGRSLAVVTMF